jgi:hypothetical protein
MGPGDWVPPDIYVMSSKCHITLSEENEGKNKMTEE